MPLSEEEQRLLDEMERSLYGHSTHSQSARDGSRVSSRGIALGVAGVVLGVAGLITGVSTGVVIWGVLGFAFLIAGVLLAMSLRSSRDAPRTQKSSFQGRNQPSQSSFMQRLEDRWDKRE